MRIRSSLAIVILLILLAIVASMNANPGHVRDLFIKAIYKEGLEPYAPIRGSTGQFASTLALRQGWVTGYQAPLFFHLLTLTSNTSTGTSALATAPALLAPRRMPGRYSESRNLRSRPGDSTFGAGRSDYDQCPRLRCPKPASRAQFKVVLRHLYQNCPRVRRDLGNTILLYLTTGLHIRDSCYFIQLAYMIHAGADLSLV